jgi:branched-chain amino acid transport system ATP-binding protein
MLLEIKNLKVHYGGVQALQDVSLDIKEGEIVCLLGGNGAGKTTLANTISGLVEPGSGEIWFNGKKINGLPPHVIVKLGIAQVPEGREIFGTLTVLENLKIGAYLTPLKKELEQSLEQVYDIFPILSERRNQLGGNLSGGEQQMLAIGRGLMACPKLLVLDEPTLGLSPIMRKEVATVTKKINQSGTSIILVEQDAQMALRISNRGLVLQNGQVVMQGPCSELLDNPELRESYLS